MIDYSAVVSELLAKQTGELTPQTMFLTIYLSNDSQSVNQLKLPLKSAIQQAFHQDEQTKHALRLEEQIIDPVLSELDKLDDLKQGVAVFIKFELIRDKKVKLEGVNLVPLESGVVDSTTLASAYNLDQLLLSVYQNERSVLVDLHRDEYQVYLFDEHQLEHVQQTENKFMEKVPDDYSDNFSPIDGKEALHYKTGTDVYQKRVIKQNELFLNQLEEYLLQEFNIKDRRLIVFYSDQFDEVIHSLREKLEDRLGEENVYLKNKTIRDEEQLRDEAIKLDKKLRKQAIDRTLESLKEDYYQVKTGWTDVTKAVRYGQVRQLFIKADVKKQGFILDEGLVFTYPAKGTHQVDNIAPWLIKSVVVQGGQVFAIDGEEYEDYPQVAARLRYKVD